MSSTDNPHFPSSSRQFLSNILVFGPRLVEKRGNLGILVESNALLQQKTAAGQNICDLNHKGTAESTIPEKTPRSMNDRIGEVIFLGVLIPWLHFQMNMKLETLDNK